MPFRSLAPASLRSTAALRPTVCAAVIAACALALAAPSHGGDDEVSIKRLADGTRLIYNENTTQRARRTAGRLLPVPSPEIDRLIGESARQAGLPRRLVQSVMQVESGYNPRALSRKGAMGLMQLMPATAAELGVVDAYDPAENVRGGTRYLQRMLDHFGELELALAAYNAGPTAVTRFGGIPPYQETQAYVRKVLELYRRTPPESAVLSAREAARERRADEARERAQDEAQRGAAVHVTRGANGEIVFTTTPPGAP